MKKVFLPSLFLLQKSMCYFHICLLYFPGKSLKEINRDYQNDGITPTYNSTPHLSDEDEFLQNWSASPRITSHQQKSKSLSRLDSVPKYIRRERELDKRASNSALASRRLNSTPDDDSGHSTPKHPSSEYCGSETSSILFEPITPLSLHQQSTFSVSTEYNNSPFFPPAGDEHTKSPVDQEENKRKTLKHANLKMQTVNGFQAMHESLDHTLNSPGREAILNNSSGFAQDQNAPAAPPRRSKISKNGTEANNNSPKIQDAITPKYTTADSAQTIKTPLLKRTETPHNQTLPVPRPSKLTKSNVLRHSFHHGTRPSIDYAHSLGRCPWSCITRFSNLKPSKNVTKILYKKW